MRATFFPFGQGIRNCIGEGFAWTESTLLLSAIVARWQLRLADGADVHPVVSSTLVPSELPIIVTRRRYAGAGLNLVAACLRRHDRRQNHRRARMVPPSPTA